MSGEQIIHVLDDDESVRDSLQWMLSNLGYTVKTYADMKSFIALMDTNPIHCLLLDLRLKGMNGLQIQKYLSECYGRNMPIIFMSGHADEEVISIALEAGAIGFLDKPFDIESLISKVEKAFRMYTYDDRVPVLD